MKMAKSSKRTHGDEPTPVQPWGESAARDIILLDLEEGVLDAEDPSARTVWNECYSRLPEFQSIPFEVFEEKLQNLRQKWKANVHKNAVEENALIQDESCIQGPHSTAAASRCLLCMPPRCSSAKTSRKVVTKKKHHPNSVTRDLSTRSLSLESLKKGSIKRLGETSTSTTWRSSVKKNSWNLKKRARIFESIFVVTNRVL